MKPIRVTLFVFVILTVSTVTLCQRKPKSKSRSKTSKPKPPSDNELLISQRPVQPDAYVILVPVPNAGGNGGPPTSNYGVPSTPGSSYGPPAQGNRGIPSPGNEISPASLDGKQEFIVTKDGIGLLVPRRSTGVRSPSVPSVGDRGPTAATLPGGHSVRVASQNGKLGFLLTRDLIPNLAPGTFVTTSGVASGSQGQSGGASATPSALPGGSGIRIGSQNGQLGLLVPRDQIQSLQNQGLIARNPGASSSSQGQTQLRAPPTFDADFPGAESLPTVFGPGNGIFGPGTFLDNSGFGQSPSTSSNGGFRPSFTPRRPVAPRQREEFGFPRATSPNANVQRATEVFTYLFNNQDTAPQLVFKDRRIL